MDPLSHSLLGAALTGSVSKKDTLRLAIGISALSAMSPDLDVLIHSKSDPLLMLEYHRGFTHSFAFIPIGALICSFIFWIFLRRKLSFSKIYLYSFIGYATHSLLDSCTSYGTQIFWPFSSLRAAWNSIGIIDLAVTLPLLIGIILAYYFIKKIYLIIPLIFCFSYLGFGFFQHEKAENIARDLASKRQHTVERQFVNPTPLNLVLWRSIYESEGKYYVDAIRISPFFETKIYEGSSVEKWTRDESKFPIQTVLGKDIERFSWFTSHWVYKENANSSWLSDLRYAALPHETNSLWSIEIDPEKMDQHSQRRNTRRNFKEKLATFYKMLLGEAIH